MASSTQLPADHILADGCQEPITPHPHDGKLNAQVTRGIRRNGKLPFSLQFSGQEIYDLRALVEKSALDAGKADDFMAAHDAVLMWEKISAQAREQGF